MDCTFLKQEKSFPPAGMWPAGWKAITHGQERDKGVLPSGNVNEGVEEGSELFSLESDGWEEPHRRVSTCPALIPARQGTARPARSSSDCGECVRVETHSLRELK